VKSSFPPRSSVDYGTWSFEKKEGQKANIRKALMAAGGREPKGRISQTSPAAIFGSLAGSGPSQKSQTKPFRIAGGAIN
jgi:hypothetical protein